MPKETKTKGALEWSISPDEVEVVRIQTIKGNVTKSVAFSVVYPDGQSGYFIVGKVGNKEWQPANDIQEIKVIWK